MTLTARQPSARLALRKVPRIDGRSLAAICVTVFLWASAFVGIRSAARHFAPGPLALGRLLAGTVALVAISLLRREGRPPRTAWPGIAASGLLWFGLYTVVLNWGERSVDAGTAALLVNVGPLVVALLSGWLLKERFPPLLLVGLGVSFTGAVVVALSTSDAERTSLFGVALCLLAALAYACGVVSQKPALRHASALQVTTYGCLVGTAACLPFAGRLVTQVSHAPLSADLTVVYLGVFPTAVAYSTWAYALARTSAGKLGATTYAAPALVILQSWLLLGELPSWLTVVGGLLCLGGVAISRRPRWRMRHAAAGGDGCVPEPRSRSSS